MRFNPGVLTNNSITEMVEQRRIVSRMPINEGDIQPSSLDLHCSDFIFRVSAGFLPGVHHTVMEVADNLIFGTAISLERGAILEKGCTYLVPLAEDLHLLGGICGVANPKSSTGRLDIFTRLITDYSDRFDTVKVGYQGPMYLIVYPQSFSIMLHPGSKLMQLRFRYSPSYKQDIYISDSDLIKANMDYSIAEQMVTNDGMILHFGAEKGKICAYKARRFTPHLDVDKVRFYDREEFWEEVYLNKHGDFTVHPDELYILASKESVKIPTVMAAEMDDIDTRIGEFRPHYAGFFDPNFTGNAVFELRGMSTPFIVKPGQPIGRLKFEKMQAEPSKLYGKGVNSNYQGQGLRLSKHFKG